MKHLWYALRYGQWYIGYCSKKELPNKPYFGYFSDYYDGYHKAFHLWRFYIAVYY
jgi:hypothetical protein